jgi:hypothetical protein
LEQLSNEVWRINLSEICKGIKGRVLGSLRAFSGEERSALVVLRCKWSKVTIGGKRKVKAIPPSPTVKF